MKFPKVLSKERLSLLSPEDRKIYEYEHSGLYPIIENNNVQIIEDINDYNILNEDISENSFNEIFDSVYFNDELINEMGLDEYNQFRSQVYKSMNNADLNTLNEYGGISIDYWMKGLKLGWLGKLTAGLLTGLVGIIAWLLMKGKDRLAMVQLKKYMNKIVELVDQGVNKKRPWYSFLMPSKKSQRNIGDYNKACFRTIQETAERNMACLYSQCIYNLGFLKPSRTNFDGITSGFVPEQGSGLDTFNNIVNSLTDNMTKKLYIPEADDALLPIKPDKEIYQNLKLPSLPTNYKMLMCNIDYPTKAKENPNGSLFMKPTEEILKAKGQDIGTAYFNNQVNLNNVINIKQETNEDYIIPYEYIQKALLEVENELTGMDKTGDTTYGGLMTGDLTGSILGKELSQEIQGKEQTKVNNFQGNIIDAIDNYIRASVPIVAKLIRAISGKSNGDRTSSEYLQLIMQMNTAAENNMEAFFKEHAKELLSVSQSNNDNNVKQLKDQQQVQSQLLLLLNKLNNTTDDKIIKKKGDFDKTLSNMLNRGLLSTKNLSNAFNKAFGKNLKKYLLESKVYDYYLFYLNENEDNEYEEDEDEDKQKNTKSESQKIVEQFDKDFIKIYNNIKNMLSTKIIGIINNDPEDWYIIKNSRERMKKLKEAADKEINAKIDLICRTANSGKSDLGDKFKAALSTHPVRAEGLKGLWVKYSDDLDDRIESRIRSITGDNGNSNILDTIKQFLSVTYPNLIGIMIYYKQIFYLLKEYTTKYPLSTKSQDDINIQNDIDNKTILSTITIFKNINNDIEK